MELNVGSYENVPTVYISGPFSENGEHTVEDHIAIAERVARDCYENGIGFICPHANTSQFGDCTEQEDHRFFLDVDLKIMLGCDAILMLPNWRNSKGATEEHEYAKLIGMPIYYCSPESPEENKYSVNEFYEHPEVLVRYPRQFLAWREINAYKYFLHVRKNYDYSPYNVNATGFVGLLTRLWDKVARLMNLGGFDIGTGEYNGAKEPKNESIDDNLLDAANYADITFLYRKGVWAK